MAHLEALKSYPSSGLEWVIGRKLPVPKAKPKASKPEVTKQQAAQDNRPAISSAALKLIKTTETRVTVEGARVVVEASESEYESGISDNEIERPEVRKVHWGDEKKVHWNKSEQQDQDSKVCEDVSCCGSAKFQPTMSKKL
jgi:hypothetical protein